MRTTDISKKEDIQKERDSNLELFRIITMFLIIAHHYVVNSGITDMIYENPLSGPSVFYVLFGAWEKTGINCFVMITGYFMCKSQITARKFFKLLGEVIFYRAVIYLIFFVTGYESFSFSAILPILFPVKNVDTGFTSCYLLFFLFIPFLNVMLQHLTARQHLNLILLSLFVYTILGTLPVFTVTMNYISWFTVVYFISSYVRLHPHKLFENTKCWGFMAIASLLVAVASLVFCLWEGMLKKRFLAFYFVSDSNKILAILVAFCCFMFFKNLKIKNSRILNRISASTFGVFLIHANSEAMRKWLWGDLLHVKEMYASSYFVFHAILSLFAIFVVCTMIDIIRIQTVEKIFLRCFDKYYPKLSAWLFRIEEKMLKKSDHTEDKR